MPHVFELLLVSRPAIEFGPLIYRVINGSRESLLREMLLFWFWPSGRPIVITSAFCGDRM